jgi:hypothetical protein
MKLRFSPTVLAVISGVMLVGAAVYVFGPFGRITAANQAVPRPVPAGDQEIVWLNAATSAETWERFVAAVHRLKDDRPELGLQIIEDATFPTQTAEVPELALSAHGSKQRLWFRWYKLTGDLGTSEWVQALVRRQPPPLAVIGGGSSDRARDLARELEGVRGRLPFAPLLLLTTATADQVDVDQQLMTIYPGRTFRFCFTNRQMAEAVADFIWSQDDLRPDSVPLYMVRWNDDPYSEDLFDQFHDVLGPEGFGKSLQRGRQLYSAARDWAWLTGRLMLGGVPPGLDLEGLRSDGLAPPAPIWSMPIPYSEGAFGRANRWEAEVADSLMTELAQHPAQSRPLLIVPAVPQPARRLLRALVQTAPVEAARFTVGTGDAIDFNTVYRDRNLAWSIQDLPFSLVFFCHRNPVDPLGFQAEDFANASGSDEDAVPDPFGKTSTGTQDLLLFRDIVATAVEAAYDGNRLRSSADDVQASLRDTRLPDGQERFDSEGNQASGTGEYVVCLRPVRVGDRVLPRARLQVWNRGGGRGNERAWIPVPVAGNPELTVTYGSGVRGQG